MTTEEASGFDESTQKYLIRKYGLVMYKRVIDVLEDELAKCVGKLLLLEYLHNVDPHAYKSDEKGMYLSQFPEGRARRIASKLLNTSEVIHEDLDLLHEYLAARPEEE